jgi:alpha-glucosidase
MIDAAAAFMLFGMANPTHIAASLGALVVTSPDGRSSITIERDASRFSVARRGESVIASSPLVLDLDGF